jgi:hypothetical protein
MFKRNVPQPRQDEDKPKGVESIEIHVRGIEDEYKKQMARIKHAQTRMRQCEDLAMTYYNKYLQRKAEIEIDIKKEYALGRRDHLGSSFDHVVDERVSKDTAASGAASNNKWYISQATMYAEIVQAEIAMMQRTAYANRGHGQGGTASGTVVTARVAQGGYQGG